MNFEPLSKLPYAVFNPAAQLLVCTRQDAPETARKAWGTRAAAAFSFEWRQIRDLVVDLLHNPQIRNVVVLSAPEGQMEGPERAALASFWLGGESTPEWGIAQMHLDLVRRFVDLYDDDCGIYGPLHPFWPERIRYAPEASTGSTASSAPVAGDAASGDVAR